MEYKKAIGPVVGVALLIVVSVVSVISFQVWLGTYSSGIFSNAEIESQSSTERISIETIVGNQLYVRGENVSIEEILIDGVECNISTEISGVGNVSLSDCLDYATSKTPEITVVTNDKVISKKIYLKDIEVDSSSSSSAVNPVYTDTFISVWNTSVLKSEAAAFVPPIEGNYSETNQIKLPLVETGTYNFNVDWGDGSDDTITKWNQSEVTHTYAVEGVYEVRITGVIKGFQFLKFDGSDAIGGDIGKILEIKAWGPLNLGNEGSYFLGCYNLIYTGSDSLDLTGTSNLTGMFAFANNFDGDISNWDVSLVTNMDSMFSGASSFNQNLNSWDVDQVTECNYFYEQTDSWEISNRIDFIEKGSNCVSSGYS